MGDQLFTPREAAAYLRLSRSALYDLIAAGHVVGFKVSPRRRLFTESELRTYIEQQQASALTRVSVYHE